MTCYGCSRPIPLSEPSYRGYEPGTLRAVALCGDCMEAADHEPEPEA